MAPASPVAKKEKILIIESDEAFGNSLADALRAEGYSAVLVNMADNGLKAIYDNLPRLIILDVNLSDGDSYDILAKKQSEPMLAKIPVFLLSLRGIPINMRRVPAGSATEFIAELQADTAMIVRKVDGALGYKPAPQMSLTESAIASNGKSILWVEDDKLIGSVLSKKLTSVGFILFLAKNGQEAIDYLKDSVPDGVVLDLLLPGMGGFEVLEVIKKDTRTSFVPVMILSNLSKQSDIERSKVLGAQKYLVKAAVSLDQIVAEIKDLCK